MELIDTHAHLDFPEYDDDREEAIRRAAEAGVTQIVTIGTRLDNSRQNIEIARRHDGVYATVGLHPHEAGHVTDDDLAQLDELAAAPEVVAVGETGLDYFKNKAPKDAQREVFRGQLAIASRHGKPVVVHSRDAKDEALRIMEPFVREGLTGVLHCFSGTPELARQALDLGLCISFTGIVTFPNAKTLAKAVRAVPIERTLIETDCPFLAPQRWRGKRNEPAYVVAVAERLAELHGLSLEDVARITTHNARALFGLEGLVDEGRIAYPIRNSLYLNITNRCSNACAFCVRYRTPYVKGHNLRMEHDPSVEEIVAAVGDPSRYDEVVFCGYGESTVRYDAMMESARRLRERGAKKLRLDTNGHGCLNTGRDVTGEIAETFDEVSVSLNTHDPEHYKTICRPVNTEADAHAAVCDFIRELSRKMPEGAVKATALEGLPGVDIEKTKALAESLGAVFRARHYNVTG